MAHWLPTDLFYDNGSKIKILVFNTFIILQKAAVLNPYKLNDDLREVNLTLQRSCEFSICHHILVLLISLLLIAKFFFGYITLAANVIAMFPILTDNLPKLLLPSMVAQTIDHIILRICEAVLGYLTIKYYTPGRTIILIIFLTSMAVKIAMAISILNIYSDFYQQLKEILYFAESSSSFLLDGN